MVDSKVVISQYFDSLVNLIEIHSIKEQFENYSNQETMEDPDGEQISIKVCDYLNKSSEKMIKQINEAKKDALKKLETTRKFVSKSKLKEKSKS